MKIINHKPHPLLRIERNHHKCLKNNFLNKIETYLLFSPKISIIYCLGGRSKRRFFLNPIFSTRRIFKKAWNIKNFCFHRISKMYFLQYLVKIIKNGAVGVKKGQKSKLSLLKIISLAQLRNFLQFSPVRKTESHDGVEIVWKTTKSCNSIFSLNLEHDFWF